MYLFPENNKRNFKKVIKERRSFWHHYGVLERALGPTVVDDRGASWQTATVGIVQ